ncbi:MAG: MATE family efflux transporter [Oscillospiraceae bacterium]|nr:MATE family efflux transporter [Oscillospiraceae bacterium]
MKGDLTKGTPWIAVCKFTFPMLISVIFQQIYSISDSIIVGKFASDGESALASVGASYSITMIYMAVAVGFNAGCSVVMSQLFGSRRMRDLKTAAATTLIFATVLSALMSIAGFAFSDDMLRLLNTPENIMKDSTLYLNMFAIGFVLLFLYNICNGIFTALGDSVTPLVFLISSSVANIILNIVFVKDMQLDVFGVALASVLTQSAAGILSFVFAMIKLSKIKTEKYSLFSPKMLGTVARYAIPSVLQQSFVSVGNIFIQSLVNGFGSSVIAGYSAAVKLNTFALSSMATLGTGISGFTAQNIGAGKLDRVSRGMKGALVMAISVSVVFFASYFFFSDGMISLFMSKGDMSELALSSGRAFLRLVSPFYAVVSVKLLCDGALRGGGAMAYFLSATFTDLLLRVALAYVLCAAFPALEYNAIWLSWPVGWTVSAVMSLVFYLTGAWKRGKTA